MDIEFSESERIIELIDEILNLSWELEKKIGDEIRSLCYKIIQLSELSEDWLNV